MPSTSPHLPPRSRLLLFTPLPLPSLSELDFPLQLSLLLFILQIDRLLYAFIRTGRHLPAALTLQILGVDPDRPLLLLRRLPLEREELLKAQRRWIDSVMEEQCPRLLC